MSEQDNMPEASEETKPIVSKKKRIIKVLIGIVVVGACAIGVNSYIDYTHQTFLEAHSKAISDIKNKNSKGYEAAFEILKELADDNKATDLDYYYLGYLYQYGLGTQKNYSNAYKYYKKSNTSQAFNQIAILYRYGEGVNKDDQKSIEYFKKSYDAGNKKAILGLAELLETNPRLISTTDPKLLYQIYLAYDSNKITAKEPNTKDKYLAAAVTKKYEPAMIDQAIMFEKAKNHKEALILWQSLLYSSDRKVADLAQKEIDKSEDLLRKQRQKALGEKEKAETQGKQLDPSILSKQKLKNLDGLIYINLLNTDKNKLQEFYKNISDIEIENDWIINSKNTEFNYINKFLEISKFKNNNSSLNTNLGDKDSNNRYAGLRYYFYNNKNEFIQNLIDSITKNKPKQSTLTTPTKLDNNNSVVFDNLSTKNNQKTQQQNTTINSNNTKTIKEQDKQSQQAANPNKEIQLTPKEKVQRMQVFAQKGDYKALYNLEHAAQKGDVYAIYYTGIYYYNLKDYEKAIEYFKEAANKNYGPAYYELGNMYYDEQENGVSFNKEKAMMYYKKAADLGVTNAEQLLMLMN
ncbi:MULTISPECIES: tetratricopeptide repeat protein [unclassified Francisella]|uniref:tetratricopeptide repeat protein n=1 Tax=unclassified Francisella TaxID=2610885 RepID=UPI002E2FF017|nr:MULTISPECIES: sel1 repeat family protein [unclassified Francisella]MED7819114.1 sel1 repeat family protein [Francisella sp. 19S2-4]MED7829926.1 sel1 repeat family protein [Francisella sp. 19S2-10]